MFAFSEVRDSALRGRVSANGRAPKPKLVEFNERKGKFRKYLREYSQRSAKLGCEPSAEFIAQTEEWEEECKEHENCPEPPTPAPTPTASPKEVHSFRTEFQEWYKMWQWKNASKTQRLLWSLKGIPAPNSKTVGGPEYFFKLFEDCYILLNMFGKARTGGDRIFAMTTFVKLRTGKSLTLEIGSLLSNFYWKVFSKEEATFVAQSGDFLKTARAALDRFDEIRGSEIFRKIHRLLMYCVTLSIFSGAGLTLDSMRYSMIEKEALRKKYYLGADFIRTILDSVLFICERGQQCWKTGSIDPLFHSGKAYEEWMEQARKLQNLAPFTANLEPHGYSLFQYTQELKDAIEKGQAISRHSAKLGKFDDKIVKKLLNDLRLTESELLTRKAAMQDRRAPFAILLHGGTSVAKSTLTTLLYIHYGKLFDLPTTSEYKYTRNSIDEYWVNFSTSKWCVQLDDIAFMHPDKAPQGDPTLMEMLQVINNVPFVPIQAALEDKGRTPLVSRLVIATTNTQQLNLRNYFSCPVAVARRMPYVVTAKPKEGFSNVDGTLDTAEAARITEAMQVGEYPDFWTFEVRKVSVSSMDRDRNTAAYNLIHTFDDVYSFIKWYSATAIAYESTQDSAMDAIAKMSKATVCKVCYLPDIKCECSHSPTPSELGESPVDRIELTAQAGPALTSPGGLFSATKPPVAPFYKVAVRPEVVARTWNEMKSCIIQDGVQVYCEPRKSYTAQLAAWWWMFMWWCYLYLPFFARITDWMFGDDWLWKRTRRHLWSNKLLRKVMWRIGCRVNAKISAHGIFAQLAAAAAFLIAIKFSYDLCVSAVAGFSSFFRREEQDQPEPPVQGESEWHIEDFLTEEKIAKLAASAKKKKNKEKVLQPSPPQVNFTAQGTNQSKLSESYGKPLELPKDAKPNVWYKEDFETSRFDVSPTIESWKAHSPEKVKEMLLPNCVSFALVEDNGKENFPVRAVCIGGHTYLTNNHAMAVRPEFVLRIRSMGGAGVLPNVDMRVTQAQIKRFPNEDLALVHLPALPARKSIVQLFGSNQVGGIHECSYLGRGRNGEIIDFPVEKVYRVHATIADRNGKFLEVDGRPGHFEVWRGTPQRLTTSGDCGLLLISWSGYGPIILGIHCGGQVTARDSGAKLVSRSFAELALHAFEQTVLTPSAPSLQAQTAGADLGPLDLKSPFRYFETGTAAVFGSLVGHRAHFKSNVRPTTLCAALERRGYPLLYGAPKPGPWQGRRLALEPMLHPASQINQSLLDQVTQEFIDEIIPKLTPEDLAEVQVLDNFTAINGIEGVNFIDKIKRGTSAGFPWKKVKKHFMNPLPPQRGLQDPVEFNDEIMSRADEIIARYEKGILSHPVFSASFKDEAIKLEKVQAHKTRVFAGAPLDFAIVVRKFFLAASRLMKKRSYLFEQAVGINHGSIKWEQLYHYLTQFGKDRVVDGDFKNFDKSMFSVVIRAAFKVLIAINRAAGYSERELRICECIAEDTSFPIYDFFGDLVQFLGTNPSGHVLTVEINGVGNSIYMRYAYALLSPDHSAKNFKRDVALMTYGDDNIMGISPSCPWFNHTAIARALSTFGVEYTMADKNAESRPYSHIDQCSFLKRTWRWDDDLGSFASPLEEASILKSLMIGVESKTITRKAQSVACITSAQREYFYYGREVFEQKTALFKELISECDLETYIEPSSLVSYDSIRDGFWSASEGLSKRPPEGMH